MLVPLIFAAVLIAAFHQTPPPAPASTSSPQPLAPPSAAPTVTPAPLPTVAPSATPAPVGTPIVLPQDAAPKIVDLRISSTDFRSGDTVSGAVITSTNVASVELRLAGYSIPVPRTDLGVFSMSYQVPSVPFFAKHAYTLQVIARNSKGDQAERDLQVRLR